MLLTSVLIWHVLLAAHEMLILITECLAHMDTIEPPEKAAFLRIFLTVTLFTKPWN